LNEVRGQFSQLIQEMLKGLDRIKVITDLCKSHWEKQITRIEKVIDKLIRGDRSGKRMIKPYTLSISSSAKRIRTESEDYSVNLGLALNRDLLQVRIYKVV
jgi:hypothetical protein